jgi:opacity protein-like surface antigen
MRRLGIVVGLLSLAATLWAPPACAFKDHTRPGWLVGVGYGGGPGQFDVGPAQPFNPERGDPGDQQRGASPQIRVGRMVARHWMLGVNYEGWFYERGDVNEKERFSLQNVTLAATFYPGNPQNATGGIFLRGGVGLGWGRYAIVPLVEVEGEIEQEHGDATDESGLGLVFGAGYEFRIAKHFAAGLAASVNYLSIGQDIFDDGVYVPVALNLSWYF